MGISQIESGMCARSFVARVLVIVLPALAVAWAAPTHGANLPDTDTVMLVAKPEFQDPLYEETILIVRPVGPGMHIGIILNKPTEISLDDVLPDHGPSNTIRDPLYLGGPADVDTLFALVTSRSSPGRGSMPLSPELFLVVEEETVGHVIRSDSEHARFFAGVVVWQPGELDEELKRGAWYVLDPEPELVLPRTTDGLWQRLVDRAKLLEKEI